MFVNKRTQRLSSNTAMLVNSPKLLHRVFFFFKFSYLFKIPTLIHSLAEGSESKIWEVFMLAYAQKTIIDFCGINGINCFNLLKPMYKDAH